MSNNAKNNNPTSAEIKEVLDQAEELQKESLKTVPAQSGKDESQAVEGEKETTSVTEATSKVSSRLKVLTQKVKENKKAIAGLTLAVGMLVVAFSKFNSNDTVEETEDVDTENNSDDEATE